LGDTKDVIVKRVKKSEKKILNGGRIIINLQVQVEVAVHQEVQTGVGKEE
jgi:hypothetical protein